ncbi:MAG: methyltransferase domain-containing protein [Methanobacteriota archaeon]|nr:MAG: methyltransferase domain-containing protein [Euryarchaeota archaeon]
MTDHKKNPIALEAYEKLAERYAALSETKFENAFVERPATISLLPEIEGKRVLDAGCGPGIYSEWLTSHGAQVVAIDVSPKMLELARQRLPNSVEIRLADLDKPLDFLEDESFDIVLCPLVLDYVENMEDLFAEFHRILLKSGVLVFSMGHPFFEYFLRSDGDYYSTELVETTWRGFGIPVDMPSFRRPLSEVINPLLDMGFSLERILEPRPDEGARELDPDTYEKLSKRPGFLCIRVRKGGKD